MWERSTGNFQKENSSDSYIKTSEIPLITSCHPYRDKQILWPSLSGFTEAQATLPNNVPSLNSKNKNKNCAVSDVPAVVI